MRQRRLRTVPVPAPMLRAVFGESATVILDSQRLEPKALLLTAASPAGGWVYYPLGDSSISRTGRRKPAGAPLRGL